MIPIEERNERIKACVADMFATSQGKWISVRDKSFGSYAETHGLESRYVGFITSILKDMGLMEMTGVNKYIRYKLSIAWYDIDKILADWQIKLEEWNANMRDAQKRRKDNQPLFSKDTNMKEETEPAKVLPKTKYHMMETKVYTMKDNKIYEGLVVGITPSETGYKHILKFNLPPKSDTELDSDTVQEPEYFKYHCLFPSIQALLVNLEKNAVKLNKH